MRLLLTLFILISLLLGVLQFSGIDKLENPHLIAQLRFHLLEEYREQSADRFNQSLEKESLGRIINRAADIFTTNIILVDTRQSQAISLNSSPDSVIIYVRFLVESSSEEPLEVSRYLKFRKIQGNNWVYQGDASVMDFYLKFLPVD